MFKKYKEWYKQQSIGKKLLLINAITTFATLLFLLILMASIFLYSEKNQMLDQAESESAIYTQTLSQPLATKDAKTAQAILSAFKKSKNIDYAVLLDTEGVALAEYTQNGDTAKLLTTESLAGADKNGQSHQFKYLHMGYTSLVTLNDKKIGYLYTESNTAKIYKHFAWFMLLALTASALAGAIGLRLIRRLQRKLMAPLYHLIDLMHNITDKNDYEQRANIESDDEIGELAKGINQMLGKIHYRERTMDRELKDKIEVEKRLDRLAHYDVITHLPNRHFFNHSLSRAASQMPADQTNFGLMFVDLDNFKTVNDTLGHHMGDALLLKVAEILKGAIRTDDVVARLGGDEFGIILNNLSRAEDAANIGRKINQEITAFTRLEGNQIAIGASIGISMFPKDADNIDTLLQNADTAMYYAKENGKNNFQFYNSDMRARSRQRATIESNLQRAIEENQLYLEYQPQFNIETNQITGVEALIRWQHPELGLVRPDEFINIAEDSGLIVLIGEWVLKTACHQAKIWRTEGLNFPVAINVSSRQFRETSLVQRFARIVEEAGAMPGWIELEVTESSLMGNKEATKTRFYELLKLGFSITLDDFGTGYSSLAHLKRYPISKIKIDRSFVNDIDKSEEASSIARTIIAMGTSLNIMVVAEGIETRAQADRLLTCGCKMGQGYLVSAAVHPDKVSFIVNANTVNKQVAAAKKTLDFSGIDVLKRPS
jgi:diguanylate cyclase